MTRKATFFKHTQHLVQSAVTLRAARSSIILHATGSTFPTSVPPTHIPPSPCLARSAKTAPSAWLVPYHTAACTSQVSMQPANSTPRSPLSMARCTAHSTQQSKWHATFREPSSDFHLANLYLLSSL